MKTGMGMRKSVEEFFAPLPKPRKNRSHRITEDDRNNYWTRHDPVAPAASRITLDFNKKLYRGSYQLENGWLTVICGEVIAHIDAQGNPEVQARELLRALARDGQLERFAEHA